MCGINYGHKKAVTERDGLMLTVLRLLVIQSTTSKTKDKAEIIHDDTGNLNNLLDNFTLVG